MAGLYDRRRTSFDAADRWVDHPYHAGVVLIGDAAAASDPCFGCGLSLTLRDVRVLLISFVFALGLPLWLAAEEVAHQARAWRRDEATIPASNPFRNQVGEERPL